MLSTKNCFKKNPKVFKLLIHFTPVWRRILMPTNYSSYSIFLLPASDYKSSLSQQNIPILGRRGHYKQYLSYLHFVFNHGQVNGYILSRPCFSVGHNHKIHRNSCPALFWKIYILKNFVNISRKHLVLVRHQVFILYLYKERNPFDVFLREIYNRFQKIYLVKHLWKVTLGNVEKRLSQWF